MQNNFFAKTTDGVEMKSLQTLNFPFELAMSGFLIENPSVLKLNDTDLSDPVIVQAELPMGKGNRADIITAYKTDKNITVAITELKKVEVVDSHVDQLLRYLKTANITYSPWFVNNRIGVLVGPSFSQSVIDAIKDQELNGVPFSHPIYGIILRRFQLNGTVVVMTEIIEPSTSQKDYTKYKLVDLQLNINTNLTKSRLVYEGVRSYAEAHPGVTLSGLEMEFPKSIGGWGSTGKKSVVIEECAIPAGDEGRYCKEAINLADGTVVRVCNQWGIKNIGGLIERLTQLGMRVDEV